MPVNTPSREYQANLAAWQRCRDVYHGSDAIKAAGDKYLPKLEAQRADPTMQGTQAYEAYKTRALFYPAFRRTVVGLGGLVCGKDPTLADVPEAFTDRLQDVTGTGVTLAGFAYGLCHELLVTGRVGALVDLPEASVGALVEPYWCAYRAEDILQVRTQRIGNEDVVTLVVLREEVEREQDKDPFTTEYAPAFRVLALKDGRYTVTVWTADAKDQTKFIAGAERVPTRRGQPLDEIPFVILNPVAATSAAEQPPLLALADVNLSHYLTSADREHGAHFTALPTPWVAGHTVGQGETLGIGSGTAWVFPNQAASCGMLEFSGAGLGALKALMEEKREMMTTLGARMLESQKPGVEAAETVKLRHAGESSELSVLAGVIGQGLSRLVHWSLEWSGVADEAAEQATVTMNPDLLDIMSPDQVRALVSSWQAGAISHETVYYNMSRGQWTRQGVSFADEKKAIDEEAPSMPKALEQPAADVVPPEPDMMMGPDGKPMMKPDMEQDAAPGPVPPQFMRGKGGAKA
jgi:hypothetical protein